MEGTIGPGTCLKRQSIMHVRQFIRGLQHLQRIAACAYTSAVAGNVNCKVGMPCGRPEAQITCSILPSVHTGFLIRGLDQTLRLWNILEKRSEISVEPMHEHVLAKSLATTAQRASVIMCTDSRKERVVVSKK